MKSRVLADCVEQSQEFDNDLALNILLSSSDVITVVIADICLTLDEIILSTTLEFEK